ncbi:MAG: Mlc titration factor MtfA (ptsG expression regulator) [Planctomycetota bacterium]|jgi:Mlc titration factor MtfA (ptsG expression regulator)
MKLSDWFHPFRSWRRRRATARPFPNEWDEILVRNFPADAMLPSDDRIELRRRVQVFLAEKNFEGLGGLELTDEVRVTIAAQACLLLLHRGEDHYAGLYSILVYPAAYSAPSRTISSNGIVTEGGQARQGEAWAHGAIVLSWDNVLRGGADPRDGHNVVLHEFAHALDTQDRHADGMPPLPSRSMYAPWVNVLGAEYRQLQDKVARRHRTVLDPYGATNPAEFFAVATETFFEKPRQLKSKHPELYAELAGFYRQDPAARQSARKRDTQAD